MRSTTAIASRLYRPFHGWMALGILASLATLVANATLLFTFYLASYGSSLATALLACLVAGGVALPWLAMRLGEEPGRRRVALLAQQRTALVDGIQGMGELLLYGGAAAQADRVQQLSRTLVTEQARLARTQGLSQAALLLAANLALWLVVWLAVPMVEQGLLAKADLALLALFTLATFEAVMPLPLAFQTYGATRAAADRLFEIVDTSPAVVEPSRPSPRPRHFGIRFEQVAFTYPGGTTPALHRVDLALAEGQRVTLSGPSGAGKSTLLQLLLRFHDPDSGRVLLGGEPLKRFHGDDLRHHIAVVSQDTHLFTGTVRDKLLLADPAATRAQLEAACRGAQIDGVIAALPEGYDTWLGEAGATLSGGQARRIAIARAVLKDAPILLLDEPTEGMDATTAHEVMTTLDRVAAGRTVILITHRRSPGRCFGEVLTMQQGQVSGQCAR